jgi:signal transduction histidine kinase
MKIRGKQRRLFWLMVASQVLLTIFVFQWLRSQFFDAREDLRDSLGLLYFDTQDQLIDTLLFRNYVSPALEGNNDTGIIIRREEQNIRWKGENGRITVSVNASQDTLRHISDTLRIRAVNENMLMRSVKLFINHAQDSAKGENMRIVNFRINPDTAEFINQYSQRLEEAGMRFLLKWHENPAGRKQSKNVLLVEPLPPFKLPAVEIQRYKGYLFGAILPQVIFGLVLVTLTALAFMLAFRSIREHVILNDLRDEFINNMTHELKTPVSTIGIALESLSKYNMKENPDIMEEYLGIASSETKRLEELIVRVLDHSLTEETNSGRFTETDLNTIIIEVTETLRPRIENGGSIIPELFPEGIMIFCDPLLMRGVIFNLVDNSIKYSGPFPIIKIITRKEGNKAIVEVNDNGPGIPEEYSDKVFEKFFRLPSHNIHNIKGYGLGLSFALVVMKKHGGAITTKNLNPGCSFTLSIPVVK